MYSIELLLNFFLINHLILCFTIEFLATYSSGCLVACVFLSYAFIGIISQMLNLSLVCSQVMLLANMVINILRNLLVKFMFVGMWCQLSMCFLLFLCLKKSLYLKNSLLICLRQALILMLVNHQFLFLYQYVCIYKFVFTCFYATRA